MDMLDDVPSSCRKLAAELRVDKTTVWEWRRKIVQGVLSDRRTAAAFGFEISQRPIRESRKGSREWVRHSRDPARFAAPDRPRWIDVDRRLLSLPLPLAAYQLRAFVNVDRLGSHPQIIPFKLAMPKRSESASVAADGTLVDLAEAGHLNAAQWVEHRWPFAHCVASEPDRRAREFPVAGKNHRAALDLAGDPLPSMDAPCQQDAALSFGQRRDAFENIRERFALFLRPFRGPAVKYLRAYVAWFIERLHNDEAGRPTAAWERLSRAAAFDRPTLNPDMLSPMSGPP